MDTNSRSFGTPWESRSREWYDGTLVQWSVAIMIVASFVGVVVEVQYQPVSGSELHSILGILEIFFTMIFVVDLCFNFYSHYFWLFMKNPWNVLDVVIVFISVLSLIIQVSLHELTVLDFRVDDCSLFRFLPPSPGPSLLRIPSAGTVVKPRLQGLGFRV
jgi:hypothetical protein